MWLRVTKHHSFLTVEFMRQASRVLWGKWWSKTPSEEGLELRGIKYCVGGDRVLKYTPAVTRIGWILKSTFSLPKIGQGKGKAFPSSGILCHHGI